MFWCLVSLLVNLSYDHYRNWLERGMAVFVLWCASAECLFNVKRTCPRLHNWPTRPLIISHAALPPCCSEASGAALRRGENTAAQAQSAGWAEAAEDAAGELRRTLLSPQPDTHTHPELLLRTALHQGKKLWAAWYKAGCGTALPRKAIWSQPDVFPVTVFHAWTVDAGS